MFADVEFKKQAPQGYEVQWCLDNNFATGVGGGSCTALMNAYRIRYEKSRLYSRPVRSHAGEHASYLVDTREWTLEHSFLAAECAKDGSWWGTDWDGRDASAELETLILLYASRHYSLMEKHSHDFFKALRDEALTHKEYGAPYQAGVSVPFGGIRKYRMYDRTHQAYSRYMYSSPQFGLQGFMVWYSLAMQGFRFPDVHTRATGMPYAGLAVGHGLLARVPHDVLFQCMKMADDWYFVPELYNEAGTWNDGVALPEAPCSGQELMGAICEVVRSAGIPFQKECQKTVLTDPLYNYNECLVDWTSFTKQAAA